MSSSRRVTVGILAAIGLATLIGASMWLAVYATRFVPEVASRIGGAAVYLGSVFASSSDSSLQVVPDETVSTTIPFDETSSTTAKPVTTTESATPVAGQKTSSTYQIGGTAAASIPNGLPDLVVVINAVGYLTSTSTDSFVASSTVPSGLRPAVSFTIKNVGTAATGPWRFSASIPTQSAFIYQSQPQDTRPLAPGDYIEYVFGFDQAISGADKMISITANFDRAVVESNPDNNSAATKITILGS